MTSGLVCGRFQPPHNEHLEYWRAAKARCDFLWIGIVRPNVRDDQLGLDRGHRSMLLSNPMTYFERATLIREILLEDGISGDSFACTPFPLDEPALLPDFVGTDVKVFTTICDPWNIKKAEVLRAMGYQVDVLFERGESRIHGQAIRLAIGLGNDDWTSVVPPATVRAVRRLNLRERFLRRWT